MKTILLTTLSMMILIATAGAAIRGEEVTYTAGDTNMKGYIAWDDAIQGKRPGILVVHEWWGHNEYARKRAKMLAELGYTALAVDMYGDGKQASHPEDAGKFSSAVKQNMDAAKARFVAAMKLLQMHPTVDGSRIGAIGYCFGGGIVLEMARAGLDLKAVASFHGSLGTDHPAQPGQVKARILVATGADDPFVKPEQVEAFKREMNAAGADYRVIIYPGAKHSFTNPSADQYGKTFNLPLEYNQAADEQSWQAMQELFKESFK